MGRRRCGLVLGATAALVLSAAGGAASAAAFSDGAATSGSTFSAATLQPPVISSTSATCEGGISLLGLPLLGQVPVITTTWTPSTQISSSSSALRNHQVRVEVSGVQFTAITKTTVTAASTSTEIIGKATIPGGVATALAKNTSHTVRVRSQWGQWLSAASSAVQVTPAYNLFTCP